MTANRGKLFLIPNTIGQQNVLSVLSEEVFLAVEQIDHFIVENEKNARRFIKAIRPEKPQEDLIIFALNKHIDNQNYNSYLAPIETGNSVGLISDAGIPGVADPGAEIVLLAHQKNITVRPLVGPSSILLAVMACGMNGQNFAFNGYLPIDIKQRRKTIKQLERRAIEIGQTQVFMETPYRNDKLISDILLCCMPHTLFTIACDITLESEQIKTKSIARWRKEKIGFHKRPCIFCLYKG